MTTGAEAFERLVAVLPEGATATVDAPADRKNGLWHLDVAVDGQSEVVTWQSGRGYGLFGMPEPSYGEKPSVLVDDPKEAVAVMLGIMERARGCPISSP